MFFGGITTVSTAYSESLGDVIAAAYAHHPDLLKIRVVKEIEEENVKIAGKDYLPIVSLSGSMGLSKINGSAIPQTVEHYPANAGITVKQTVFDSGFRKHNLGAAKFKAMGVDSSMVDLEQRVLLGVIESYASVLEARWAWKIAGNNRDMIQERVEMVRNKRNLGGATKTDVAQAESRLAGSIARVANVERVVVSAEEGYRNMIGQKPADLAPLSALPEMPVSDLDQALEMARAQNPLLKVAGYGVDSAKENIDKVRWLSYIPEVSLVGSLYYNDDTQGISDHTYVGSIAIKASLPLFSGGAERSRLRQSRSILNQKMLELRKILENVEKSVIVQWNSLRSINTEVQSLHDQLQSAEIAYLGVVEEESAGSRTVLDVLNAQQEFLQARLALVQAESRQHVAYYRMFALLGVLTPKAIAGSQFADSFDGQPVVALW
jgi:TolC family type I secretion outer membrane protein